MALSLRSVAWQSLSLNLNNVLRKDWQIEPLQAKSSKWLHACTYTVDVSNAVSTISNHASGGFRNSERGVQPLARKARLQIFGLPRPLSVTLEVQTEYLEATLGLVKCLEISKELIHECVTCLVVVAACHSYIIIWWTRAVMYAKIHLHPPYPSGVARIG